MTTRELQIAIDGIELAGILTIPPRAIGLVMFAHGSGSSRHSPRNRQVAQVLQARGLATLLFDLLTADEERIAATDSIVASGLPQNLPIAYFGGSTGAAAALIATPPQPQPRRRAVPV